MVPIKMEKPAIHVEEKYGQLEVHLFIIAASHV